MSFGLVYLIDDSWVSVSDQEIYFNKYEVDEKVECYMYVTLKPDERQGFKACCLYHVTIIAYSDVLDENADRIFCCKNNIVSHSFQSIQNYFCQLYIQPSC